MREKNKKQLSENSDVFGSQTMGDGTTIKKMPLFNVLAATYGCETIVSVVHDVSEHLAAGGKKDASQILDILQRQTHTFDSVKENCDLCIVNDSKTIACRRKGGYTRPLHLAMQMFRPRNGKTTRACNW